MRQGGKVVPVDDSVFSATFNLLNEYHPIPSELFNLGETFEGGNLDGGKLRDLYGFKD